MREPTNHNQLTGGERILSLIVSVYAATLIDKVGRRKLFLISTTGKFSPTAILLHKLIIHRYGRQLHLLDHHLRHLRELG